MSKDLSGQERDVNLIGYSELSGCAALEIFNISVIFHVIDSYGAKGGLLVLCILASAFASGLINLKAINSKLFDPYRFAARLNVVRFILSVVAIAILSYEMQQVYLVLIAMFLSSIRPHLDAAVFSGLSGLGLPEHKLKLATAKVDNASRIARILSPAIVGSLAYLMTYENISALSSCLFLAAAIGQYWTFKRLQFRSQYDSHVTEELANSRNRPLKEVENHDTIFLKYAFFSQGLNAGCWYASMVIGMALVFSNKDNELGVSSYAIVGLCYGFGNVFSNMLCRRIRMPKPVTLLISGRALTAFGFMLLLIVPDSLWFYGPAAFLLATGTPLSDLAFLRQLQRVQTPSEISFSYRTKITSEYAGMLLVSLVTIFIAINYSPVAIFLTAFLVMSVVSIIGLSLKKAGSIYEA